MAISFNQQSIVANKIDALKYLTVSEAKSCRFNMQWHIATEQSTDCFVELEVLIATTKKQDIDLSINVLYQLLSTDLPALITLTSATTKTGTNSLKLLV